MISNEEKCRKAVDELAAAAEWYGFDGSDKEPSEMEVAYDQAERCFTELGIWDEELADHLGKMMHTYEEYGEFNEPGVGECAELDKRYVLHLVRRKLGEKM